MKTTTGHHLTAAERRAIKTMREQGIADARIGRKEYHIRESCVHIIEVRKPMGFIGERAELVCTMHKL